MKENSLLNKHNKQEFPPMHTAEHILNHTMVKMFGCERSKISHIERKKSRCDYFIPYEPSAEIIQKIEENVNDIIKQNLPVTENFTELCNIPSEIDISKLPKNVGNTVRIIKIGDYDICACIGLHVKNTSEIGRFKIISTDFLEGKLRIRFKLIHD